VASEKKKKIEIGTRKKKIGFARKELLCSLNKRMEGDESKSLEDPEAWIGRSSDQAVAAALRGRNAQKNFSKTLRENQKGRSRLESKNEIVRKLPTHRGKKKKGKKFEGGFSNKVGEAAKFSLSLRKQERRT